MRFVNNTKNAFRLAIAIFILALLQFNKGIVSASEEENVKIDANTPKAFSQSLINVDVDSNLFTGEMRYSMPVEVPVGRKGIEPKLALSYGSNGGNGWLGVGWTLNVGGIERNTRFGVNYAGDDYVINNSDSSAELIKKDAVSNEYSAKIEDGSYKKIIKKSLAYGIYYWEVTDKSGTVYVYGKTDNSRQYDPDDQKKGIQVVS